MSKAFFATRAMERAAKIPNQKTFFFGIFLMPVAIALSPYVEVYWNAILLVIIVISFIAGFDTHKPITVDDKEYYSTTISKIDKLEVSLGEVCAFLEKERSRIKETQEIIQKLEEEKDTLNPIVETNRQTVDAILSYNSEKQRINIWKERFIGLGLGIVGSLIVMLIERIFKYE